MSEIEATRERLGQNLDVLAARLPDPDDARRAATAAGAGLLVVALGLWWTLRRWRRRRARAALVELLEEAGLSDAARIRPR